MVTAEATPGKKHGLLVLCISVLIALAIFGGSFLFSKNNCERKDDDGRIALLQKKGILTIPEIGESHLLRSSDLPTQIRSLLFSRSKNVAVCVGSYDSEVGYRVMFDVAVPQSSAEAGPLLTLYNQTRSLLAKDGWVVKRSIRSDSAVLIEAEKGVAKIRVLENEKETFLFKVYYDIIGLIPSR